MIKGYLVKKYFIFIFIVLIIILHSVMHTSTDETIKEHFEEITQQRNLEYQVIYNNYKIFIDMIFNTMINTEDIHNLFENRDRVGLKSHLDSNYLKLRKYSIRQLHFHLPNNDSFLRMHRPNKYGDNLTKDRLTVKFVNENKKFIDGFEEGKIFNGFRFVYPLFKDEKYLGSVEISFSALFFIKEMVENYKVKTNFFINKEIVGDKVFKSEKSNYQQSLLDPYLVQKSIIKYLGEDLQNKTITNEFKTKIYNGLKKNKIFSITYNNDINIIVTIIPLHNPITKNLVAFLSIKSYDTFIERKKFNSRLVFALGSVIIAIGLLLVYRQLKYQYTLQKNVDEKTKELELEILKIKKLKEEKLKQQEILLKQEKMASMGDMIGNIAHQWRQPLSVISTAASGMQIQKEFDMLTDEQFDISCTAINKNAQYLSKTIDDFRNFIKGDRTKSVFNLKEEIYSFLSIVDGSIKKYDIKIIMNLEEDIEVDGYKNELTQCFINIFNNAKDILVDVEEERLVFITTKKENDKTIIQIKDNAGGIPSNILPKIFDPYFTTKHQSQGTGLGLHMTYNLIVDGMKGSIEAYNDTYEYEGKSYSGAIFKIEI